MREKFIDYFSRFMPLTEEEKAAIREGAHIQNFPKGTILLKEGEISKAVYFILKGCIRQYYIIDGEEKTSNFFTEEQWVISLNSHSQKIPADHYFDCLEDCTLVIGTEEEYNPMYAAFPKFEIISRNIIEKQYGSQQVLQASYVTYTAEQRYLSLLKHRSDLINRVPQYQLASYIGVKPESLSRIRKRLAKKG